MQKPTLGRDRTIDFQITPMIDVVFLLIIFFLVSSHLARQESAAPLDLPTARSSLEPHRERLSPVTINVLPDRRLLWGREAVSLAQVAERLRWQQQRRGDALEVRIRADRTTPYGRLESLLRACHGAGVEQVAFAVIHESETPR